MSEEYHDMPDVTYSHNEGVELGPMLVPTENGPVLCVQGSMLKTAHMTFDSDIEPVVAVFALDEEDGIYVTLSPNDARAVAAAIIRSADAAEAGYGAVQH